MVFVVTIEGMHALGTDTHLPEVMRRIEAIKQWSPPVIFISFAHHVDNGLCGHAYSFPAEATLFADQRANMQAPFNELGLAAARYLLSLDQFNRKNTGALSRRISIDVKHMSAAARRQYYDQIVRPCMLQQPPDVIPVIASHVGYSGVNSLADQEANYRRTGEPDDFQVVSGLNAWNINVCDEDVQIILQTEGLLGLYLDQRILGQKRKEHRNGIDLLWHNLSAMVQGVRNNPALSNSERLRFWNCICLGTDFEGYIDPADNYPAALSFDALKQELLWRLHQVEQQGLQWQYFMQKSAQAIVDDVCLNNVLRFLQKHFN